LFPHVWRVELVRDAFIGYGLNQRKKFLEDKDARPAKYASAYLRVLYQAAVLIEHGYVPVEMRGSPVYETLQRWRGGLFTKGEVIDTCLRWQETVETLSATRRHPNDLDAVNTWLLQLRRESW
jgi:hypothetical protein